jgi:polar amino acid transport system substrate-binding protein
MRVTVVGNVARVAAVAAIALAVAAGCGSPPAPTSAGPAADVPRPVGVQDPAKIPKATASAAPTCNPRASLRPPAPMPAAGQMPAGSTMATILERGRLIVGVDQNSYLFGYRSSANDATNGQIVGFDIDMAHEVARAIFGDPNRIQFKAITSADRIPVLQKGQVDLVSDSMTINCERLQQVEFSTDYFDSGQRVLVMNDSTARGIDDLGGKKVCAAGGTTSIQNIAEAGSHPVPVAVNDWTDCLVMLQQHQVDAISTDDSILAGLAAQDPNTKLVGPKFTDEPHGLAMNKSNTDLVRFVNGVLERIRTDGTWKAIYNRWLGSLGAAPTPPAAQYLG